MVDCSTIFHPYLLQQHIGLASPHFTKVCNGIFMLYAIFFRRVSGLVVGWLVGVVVFEATGGGKVRYRKK